jgi:tetratricopeptide (TPR) repeat protein
MDTGRERPTGGRTRAFAAFLCATLLLPIAAAPPAGACPSSRRPPDALECLVRSKLAESSGDPKAVAWALSFASLDPRSSFAASQVAGLFETLGDDSAALSWGERALTLDSLNAEAAMLVGRLSCLAGTPSLAVKALTPPLRQTSAMPELFALRALAHELNRDYEAALADLGRTGPLLHHFGWIATGVLGMALEDGQLQVAHSAFQFAMALDPGDVRTLALGVSLAQRLGDPKLEGSLLRALRASGVR